MTAGQPILHISKVVPQAGMDEFQISPITLQLMPGELALVDARDARRSAWFADLCCGLVPLAEGTVKFLDRDWTAMPHDYAAAMRGRIGRVFATGGWIEFLDMPTNILLPQFHHTRRDARALREEAASLAYSFGLPGLPMSHPRELSDVDLARAACIRAFLGEPALLLLESPLQDRFANLSVPLLEALATRRQNGAAAIWMTRSHLVWRDPSIPVTHRLRLSDHGLLPARRAA